MCTALTYKTNHHYFGRNLDLEKGYNEGVVITPQNFTFSFRYEKQLNNHYAMIGMAATVENYPLYFDATNEKGLSMAGLNFPGNAYYPPLTEGKTNVAPFELIPYLLGTCSSVEEVVKTLESTNVVQCNFSGELPTTPLHWLISDKERSVVFECTKTGMQVWDNPFGVLTNNPPFEFHLANMNNYMYLHPGAAENRFADNLPLENYSLGLGAMGLPGDFSSASRFVKVVFVKENSLCDSGETESVNQFFHILQSVAMPRGCVLTPGGEYEYTRYSSCCNTDTQTYYYTTYQNSEIKHVCLGKADLNATMLSFYPIE